MTVSFTSNYLHVFLTIFVGFSTLVCRVNAIPGWTLDESCAPYNDQVRKVIESSFQFAVDANTELQKPALDPQVQTVYDFLFDNSQSAVNGHSVFDRIKSAFSRVVAMNKEKPMLASGSDDSIVFFCDYARYGTAPTQPGPPPMWFDSKRVIEVIEDESFLLCRDGPQKKGDKKIMAYASSRERLVTGIQFCPWYLKKSLGSKLFDQSKGNNIAKTTKAITDKILGKSKKTQIDTISLIQSTLLHEMFHSYQATKDFGTEVLKDKDNNEVLDPITNQPVMVQIIIGDDAKYEWDDITKNRAIGHLSADNYAYFGQIVSMMKRPEKAQTVDRQGKLQDIATLAKRLLRAMRWIA